MRRTYADFMNSDCGNTFAEYLGINAPTYVYNHDGLVMMQRFDHLDGTVKGAYCKTKNEAKVSYKDALARHRASLPKRPVYGCGHCSVSDIQGFAMSGAK